MSSHPWNQTPTDHPDLLCSVVYKSLGESETKFMDATPDVRDGGGCCENEAEESEEKPLIVNNVRTEKPVEGEEGRRGERELHSFI